MTLRIGNAAILAYRRLPYRPWYAIAEFVDNSTDAYYRGENRKILDEILNKEGKKLSVEVDYNKQDGTLFISDNSMGMSLEELDRALIIGEKPLITSGRSEFGMGMKTAAIWFADIISIRTKKLGEKFEYGVKIDIQKFVQGIDDLETSQIAKDPGLHYTHIELSGLQRKIGDLTFKKTAEFLGSIYRQDLRNKQLELTINANQVKPPTSREDDSFVKRTDGSKALIEINNLQINDKSVSGWVGVLAPGFTGRSYAGFALIRHGRTVKGYLDSWRPEEIFGDARNDTLNQRIAGELIMDNFSASHTKDAIDWESDDEEILGKKLKEICIEYDLLRLAKKKTRGVENEDSQREANEAHAQLIAQLQNQKVQDTIKLLDVPSPELAKLKSDVLIDSADGSIPVGEWIIDASGRKAKLYEISLSPNDPYYEFEILHNADLRIVINSDHPAASLLDSAEARLAHYHHVLLDAISEWKCMQMDSPMEPSSMRIMKDHLFRAIGTIDQEI